MNIEEIARLARTIKLLILDVDGVLTDGRLFFDNNGEEYKSFHARDGHGIKLLRQTGVEVAVISGRKSESVKLRLERLGIEFIYQGYEEKLNVYKKIIAKLLLNNEQVAYVGDDLLDLPVMTRVGLPVAVADANFAVKDRALWTTDEKGGLGAVREVCDLIMQAQGNLDGIIQSYL